MGGATTRRGRDRHRLWDGCGYASAAPEEQAAVVQDVAEAMANYSAEEGVRVPFCLRLGRGWK